MDRGENRRHNYISQRDHILSMAENNSKGLLKENSQEIIEAVHNFQFEELNRKIHLLTEVDIVGLGRYYFSKNKAITRLKNLEASIGRELGRIAQKAIFPPTTKRLESMREEQKLLQYKINQQDEFEVTKRVPVTGTRGNKES